MLLTKNSHRGYEPFIQRIRKIMDGKKIILLAISLIVGVIGAMNRNHYSTPSPGPCLVIQGTREMRPWTTGSNRKIIVPKAVRPKTKLIDENEEIPPLEGSFKNSINCLTFAVVLRLVSPVGSPRKKNEIKRSATSLRIYDLEKDFLGFKKCSSDINVMFLQHFDELSTRDTEGLEKALIAYGRMYSRFKNLSIDARVELMRFGPTLVQRIEENNDFTSPCFVKPLLSFSNRFLSQDSKSTIKKVLLERIEEKIMTLSVDQAEFLLKDAQQHLSFEDTVTSLNKFANIIAERRRQQQHVQDSNGVGDNPQWDVFPGYVQPSPQQVVGWGNPDAPIWMDFPSGPR